MLRAVVRTIKIASRGVLLLVAMTSLLATGCFSHRYPRLMQVHLEVLSLFGAKLAALAQDGHTVRAEDWGEFTYPLERARGFARLAAEYYPERASLRDFNAALDAYQALAADPAILAKPDAAATVARRQAAFLAAAERTRADLAREHGS
jgi:hypothetical protein